MLATTFDVVIVTQFKREGFWCRDALLLARLAHCSDQ